MCTEPLFLMNAHFKMEFNSHCCKMYHVCISQPAVTLSLLTEMIFSPSELLRHFEWDKIEQSKAVSNMCFLLSIKQPVHCRPPLSTGMC